MNGVFLKNMYGAEPFRASGTSDGLFPGLRFEARNFI